MPDNTSGGYSSAGCQSTSRSPVGTARRRRRLHDLRHRRVVLHAGARQLETDEVGLFGSIICGHSHRQLATGRVADEKQAGSAGVGAEDLVDGAVGQRDALFRPLHGVRVGRRTPVPGPIQRHHGVAVVSPHPQQRQRRVPGAVEIRCGT